MLDIKVNTFLSLYKNRSYTKAAEELCITQPAVTQHIQSLENYYDCKFFHYSNRQLKVTKAGELFYKYALSTKVNEKNVLQKIKELNRVQKEIRFATTLTIGEFTLPPILDDFMKTFHEYRITMYVDNTEKVLELLQKGQIHFALVEGLFNKSDYATKLYKTSRFILTAPITHPFIRMEKVSLKDIMEETMIIREKGSGSREVLERGLFDKNYTLQGFKNTIEIGNVNVIKEMVKREIGLSFMYEDAVRKEIENKELVEIVIEDFIIEREFNFIYLENNIMKKDLEKFLSFFRKVT